jgi:lipoprotein-anchoring transpeptidase ErfK/SrfK
MDPAEVAKVANKLISQIKVKASYGGKTVDVPLDGAGVAINVDETVQDVLSLNGKRTVFSAVDIWVNRKMELAADYDAKNIQGWLNKAFPESHQPAKNAALAFSDGQFVVSPSAPGSQINSASLIAVINDALAKPKAYTAHLTTKPLAPVVNDDQAAKAAVYMNERVGLQINLNLNGQLIYRIEPQEIVNFVTVKPGKGRQVVEVDKAKVEQFIVNQVGQYVPSTMINQKVFISPQGTEIVLQAGQNGYALTNPGAAASAVIGAIIGKTDLNQELEVAQTTFNTETIKAEGESWIDVNLSQQTTSLYTGSRLLASYRISSGMAATPTNPGTFKVWSKMRVQTMKGVINGERYEVPNVEWISYFDKDGRAFHATYWHSNFGTPMSHGCINMTYPAAITLYQFAPVGTRVEVHY